MSEEKKSHAEFLEDYYDKQFADIQLQLSEIRETLVFVKDTIVKADTTITSVAEQVMPTINDLMKSPMLKMLGVKSK